MTERIPIAEAADLLSVSTETIRRMFHAGKLEGVQPNAKILINVSAVDRIIEKRQRAKEREEALREAVQPVRRKG